MHVLVLCVCGSKTGMLFNVNLPIVGNQNGVTVRIRDFQIGGTGSIPGHCGQWSMVCEDHT